MKIEFDKDHVLEYTTNGDSVYSGELRLSRFGVNKENKLFACAEFSNEDKTKILYVGLSLQTVYIMKQDGNGEQFFIYYKDYLGSPIQPGEEDHGDKYFHRTKNDAFKEWWQKLNSLINSYEVTKSYYSRNFTTYPNETDKQSMQYMWVHGDIEEILKNTLPLLKGLE